MNTLLCFSTYNQCIYFSVNNSVLFVQRPRRKIFKKLRAGGMAQAVRVPA
jgi:hypothetical protein